MRAVRLARCAIASVVFQINQFRGGLKAVHQKEEISAGT
jgi:hypothetical protein